jgi:PIN domain nuclease of toxin-antitoxin system
MVSAASAWEISTKVRLGKLEAAAELAADFSGHMEREGFQLLSITPKSARYQQRGRVRQLWRETALVRTIGSH